MKIFNCSRILIGIALWVILAHHSSAYGPIGHQIVGAIADERLAKTTTGKRVAQLLDGLTLEKASVIADEIKGWDKKGADDPGIFHYSARPRIDAQLRAFWRANQPTQDLKSSVPSHHWFHYTDVPVLDLEKYSDGKIGRSQWDIVHMISYCIAVLKGETPEENPRKITKAVAVILLAHYVGDIHQPLHVGAEYFDQTGHPTNPDRGKPALEDQGGNTIALQLARANGRPQKFHGYWDNDVVNAQFPSLPEAMPKEERRAKIEVAKTELVHKLATQEPRNWRLPVGLNVKDYPEAWANEILPIAREAHERLNFIGVHPELQEDGSNLAFGSAAEKAALDHVSYRAWSARIAHDELHKAGWRLADLLEKLGGGSTQSATFPSPVRSK